MLEKETSAGEAYFLGIDGGGTKTDCFLVDSHGAVLSQATAGPSNPLRAGYAKAWFTLSDAADLVLERQHLKSSDIRGICAGIGGAGRANVAKRIATFLERGFPAVRFTEPAEDFHRQHQDVREENGVTYGDTPDHVDFAYTADVARVNAAALAVLARAPEPPSAVQVETARLENDTTLRWAPSPEADLAGYRIVWRETTAPFWEHSMDVGKAVNRITVPDASKDNLIFGVEAFDTAGHASPAVFPSARKTL